MKLFKPRNIAMVIIIVLLAAIGSAFAAANIVPETGAGDGQDDITGYTITNVTYDTMDGDTDPSSLDRVTLDVASTTGTAGAATEVKVKLVDTSTTWFDCTLSAGTTWTCPITGVDTLDANELRVVAAQ